MSEPMTASGDGTPQPPGRTPQRSALRPGGETLPARGQAPGTPVPPEASALPASAPSARRTAREADVASAVVVGTGLIGTSIALALRERGVRVGLADQDPAAARLAADIGAGTVVGADFADLGEPADLAVLAVPP